MNYMGFWNIKRYNLIEFSANVPGGVVDYVNNPKAEARAQEAIQLFKKLQIRSSLGEGFDHYFNLGDMQSNPFMRKWINSKRLASENRIAKIFSGQADISIDKAE